MKVGAVDVGLMGHGSNSVRVVCRRLVAAVRGKYYLLLSPLVSSRVVPNGSSKACQQQNKFCYGSSWMGEGDWQFTAGLVGLFYKNKNLSEDSASLPNLCAVLC